MAIFHFAVQPALQLIHTWCKSKILLLVLSRNSGDTFAGTVREKGAAAKPSASQNAYKRGFRPARLYVSQSPSHLRTL